MIAWSLCRHGPSHEIILDNGWIADGIHSSGIQLDRRDSNR